MKMDFNEFMTRTKGANRFLILSITALALATTFALATSFANAKAQKRASAKNSSLSSFNELKASYIKEKAAVEPFEKKLLMPASKPLAALIEEAGSQTGLKEKIKSLKPYEEEVKKGYQASGIDVAIEGVTLNQLVNFLYRIENHRNLLLTKEFSMKAQFNNPGLFDITMKVALVSRPLQ